MQEKLEKTIVLEINGLCLSKKCDTTRNTLLNVFPSYSREIVLETFLFPKYLPLKATTGIIGIILSIVDLKQITFIRFEKRLLKGRNSIFKKV